MVGEAILDKGGMPSPEQLEAMGESEATARGAQSLILLSKENSPEEQRAVKAMIDATAPQMQVEQQSPSASAAGESSAINTVLMAQPPLDTAKDASQTLVNQTARSEIEEALLSAGVMPEKQNFDTVELDKPQLQESLFAVGTDESLERLANSMYDTGSVEKNMEAFMRDEPLRQTLKSGLTYPLEICLSDQNVHIEGTTEYEKRVTDLRAAGKYGPSRLTISVDEMNTLIRQYAGTGILERSKRTGEWTEKEIITVHTGVIGVAVNDKTGVEAPTTTFKIHYSKKRGVHIVPDYPSKKGAKARK